MGFLRALTLFAGILFTTAALALTPAQRAVLTGGPNWTLKGSSVDLNFARNAGSCVVSQKLTACSSVLTITRASTGYAQWADGHLSLFAANAPRITDQGLLVEEARTNLALQSQTFDVTWAPGHAGVGTDAVVTANAGTAPDGATTADRVQLALNGGTSTADQSFIGQLITVSNTTAYAATVYLKSNTASSYAVQLVDSSGSGITNITVTPSWQRFTLLETTAGTIFGFRIRLRGGQTPTNADRADILAWGAQLEAGPFATSPIPTTTVAVTRAADSVNLTTAAGSIISSLQGSLRVETFAIQQDGYIVSIDSTNSRFIRSSAASQMHSDFTGTLLTASAGSGNRSGSMKTSLGWNVSGRSLVVNNGTLTSDSAVPSSLSASGVYLGSNTDVNGYGDGYIKRVTAWTSRLSDAQLQALTQ